MIHNFNLFLSCLVKFSNKKCFHFLHLFAMNFLDFFTAWVSKKISMLYLWIPPIMILWLVFYKVNCLGNRIRKSNMNFGMMLMMSWNNLGVTVWSIRRHFGIKLRSLWDHAWLRLRSLVGDWTERSIWEGDGGSTKGLLYCTVLFGVGVVTESTAASTSLIKNGYLHFFATFNMSSIFF